MISHGSLSAQMKLVTGAYNNILDLKGIVPAPHYHA